MNYLDKEIIADIFSQQLRSLPIEKENDTKYLH